MTEWADENPYYLLIVSTERQVTEVDLGSRGWLTTYADRLRSTGTWYLVQKDSQVIRAMIRVYEGEQPYYVARHVGFASSAANTETIAYGLGKKRRDGHVDRIWLLTNGVVVTGDDVEDIALELLKQGQL